uniref:Uncharacterized protein n=1 Tax=Russula subnigricans TaxID=258989 RepID=A0A649WI15_9AGAM|nr:hypothetical protein [Russula subnigricans]QGK88090.1 hypothetical protein [Russula subnigricans]
MRSSTFLKLRKMKLLKIFIYKLKTYLTILLGIMSFYTIFNIFYFPSLSLFDIVCFANDNSDINLHTNVTVNKEAGKAISPDLQTIGNQIGLRAIIVGIAIIVGKAITNTVIPIFPKAGVILVSFFILRIAHSRISIMNRNMINDTDLNTSTSIDNNSNISEISNDLITSPLEDLLINFEMMNYVCLSLTYIIVIQLFFKLCFKNKINLKFFYMLNANWITKINYYLNKIIKINKQMSVIWTWIGILSITFGLCFDAYTLHDVYVNIDSYVNKHNLLHSNFVQNNLYVVGMSISYKLLFSRIINFLSMMIMFSLILVLKLKFHSEKIVSNTFIWILIILLILNLAFSAYSYHELYTNMDSYVHMHLNMINK